MNIAQRKRRGDNNESDYYNNSYALRNRKNKSVEKRNQKKI